MAVLAVTVDTLAVEGVVKRLASINTELLERVSLAAVNEVADRAYTESRKRLTERVNLTDDYVRSRMDLEPANDARKPEAVIVAFRSGGRKTVRPVNLRQYKPIYDFAPARPNPDGAKTFTMKDGRLATNKGGGQNPRKPGTRLPFVIRKGNPAFGVPTGQKLAGLSVEVLKGVRKTILPKNGFGAFMQKMRNGETLVMRRTNKNGGKSGKGSIEALYSLSVWQMFRNVSADIVPIVRNDLEATLDKGISDAVKEVFK